MRAPSVKLSFLKLSFSREETLDCEESIRSNGRNVMKEKLERENGQAEGRIKDSLSENSEEIFEFGSELVRTGCSNQDEAMGKFQNVIVLIQLSELQAEQLSLSMLGEENRQEQVGIRYLHDQRSGQEINANPSKWLETNIASTEFEKE